MAIKVSEAAAGNAPSTGNPGPTPAPKKPMPGTEVNSGSRDAGPQCYGQNGPVNPSVTRPGETVTSLLGQNLRASVSDPALDTIISKGVARQADVGDDSGRSWNEPSAAGGYNAGNGRIGDGLLRDIATGNSHISHNKSAPSPVHPSMAANAGSPSGKVGATNDYSQTGNPVRKPPAQ